MSNALAVATVTASLRHLLEGASDAFPGLTVTAKPPDRARVGETGNQLNIFLYHLGPDAALRNAEIPRPTGAARFRPPLALTLEYMLTAFAPDDEDVQAHMLLGRAMGLLHDSSDLDPALLSGSLPGNDLDAQPERVRVTPSTLPIDELSRLWTSYQTNFRLSTAYTVSVVLIDSALAVPTPLPVLSRGSDNRGAKVNPGSQPRLDRVFPDFGPSGAGLSAQLGDRLVLEGAGLVAGDTAVFRRVDGSSLRLPTSAADGGSERLLATLPDAAVPGAAASWIAGPHAVSVIRGDDDEQAIALASNEVGLTVAPTITVAPLAAAAGDVALTISCLPQVRTRQIATLLLGEREVHAPTLGPSGGPDSPTVLTFDVPAVPAGTYTVRLRVGAAVSRPIAGSATGVALPTSFDPAQQVTVS
jgi:hypothetical protein